VGRHAHDAMRQEIKNQHGFDIGGYNDPLRKAQTKPVYKRVQCPYCESRPKEAGLWQHVHDVHAIDITKEPL